MLSVRKRGILVVLAGMLLIGTLALSLIGILLIFSAVTGSPFAEITDEDIDALFSE